MKLMTYTFLMLLFICSCRSLPSQNQALLLDQDDDLGEPRGQRQLARFAPWMATVKEAMETKDSIEVIAGKLVEGPMRVASYNLQALGRLYAKEDKIFPKIRDDFKDLEDGIGEYDKWNNILGKAEKDGKTKSTLAELKDKREKALNALKSLLEDRKWIRSDGGETRITKIQGLLDAYDWSKPNKDRKLVIKNVISEVKDIRDVDYDLRYLEKGNGLHELRRNLKWVVIELRTLNGAVTFNDRPDNCPLKKYRSLLTEPIANSKYSKLPSSAGEPNPCLINQCVFLGIVKMVDDLGEIKDIAEAKLNSGSSKKDHDLVPDGVKDKAKDVYKTMVSNDLLGTAMNELQACVD